MAANRGVKTFLSVFLLCCCRGTELQSVDKTSGPVTDSSFNATNEEMPEVFDEIIAQEILEPNVSAVNETPTTKRATRSTKQTKEKNAGADDSYQEDGSENYHEVVDISSTNKENEDSNEKKSSSNINYKKVSILDRILQNIGRSEGDLGLTESIF